MGRMAAHTGQVITFDEMLNCEHEFAPDVDKLTMNGPAPLQTDAQRQVPGPAARHRPRPRVRLSRNAPQRRALEILRPVRHLAERDVFRSAFALTELERSSVSLASIIRTALNLETGKPRPDPTIR